MLHFNASNNKVLVVSHWNHRIKLVHFDLTFSNTFGTEDSGCGQFQSVCGIACDSTGNVCVTDSGNHNIQVFTANGKFVRMFGRCGQGRE